MATSLGLALAIATGVAAGVFLNPSIVVSARWLVAGFGTASFLLAARGAPQIAKWIALGGLAAACVIWGADAEQRALRPPLRQLLTDRVGHFDIDSLDTDRHDIPMAIEGRL